MKSALILVALLLASCSGDTKKTLITSYQSTAIKIGESRLLIISTPRLPDGKPLSTIVLVQPEEISSRTYFLPEELEIDEGYSIYSNSDQTVFTISPDSANEVFRWNLNTFAGKIVPSSDFRPEENVLLFGTVEKARFRSF